MILPYKRLLYGVVRHSHVDRVPGAAAAVGDDCGVGVRAGVFGLPGAADDVAQGPALPAHLLRPVPAGR